MGALEKKFSGAGETQADAGKYTGFAVGYFGDEAAIVFSLRCSRQSTLAEESPYSHSDSGRRKGYALRITSQNSETFPIDLLEAKIANIEEKTPDSPDLAMLKGGKAELEGFIGQNGRYNLEASCRPQEFACA